MITRTRILLIICCILILLPMVLKACPPDCGDCKYWDGDSCEWSCSSSYCCGGACRSCCDNSQCGECKICSSYSCVDTTTVSVISITSSNSYNFTWDGNDLSFDANSCPGTSFPSEQPVWTATVGTFPSGNTGSSVTWRAPSGSGGYADITATYNSSYKTATATYGYVSLGGYDGGNLLREGSDSFYATVEPEGLGVTLSEHSSSSEYLNVDTLDLFVEIENDILDGWLYVGLNTAVAKFEATFMPETPVKILGKKYNLQKNFLSWWNNVELPEGEDLYDWVQDHAVDEFGDGIYDEFINMGFNSTRANDAKEIATTAFDNWFNISNPFPQTPSNSIVSEEFKLNWTASYSFTSGIGEIKIKQSGYPGWPEIDPPSLQDCISGINEHGFTYSLFNIESQEIEITITPENGEFWMPSASITFITGDDWCHYENSWNLEWKIEF